VIEHVGARSAERWEELRDGEDEPFGSNEYEWREKDLFTYYVEDGRALAAVGLVIVDAGAFDVVGVGDVIVTHSRRGQGLLRPTLDAALERAATLGPDLAMLFCSPSRTGLYGSFGFHTIDAPVSAAGRRMRPSVMWRPLRAGAIWPEGPISLPGLPF
jgi:GNAT superfamily N-acetyltransferase